MKWEQRTIERKWQRRWEEDQIYKFHPESNKPIYSIDTPPPYASGKLHLGHAMHYNQFEFIARYKRMRGFNVFYPFGFDDNGLPTERYVEKELGITKDETTREKFKKLCRQAAGKLIEQMKQQIKTLGHSCDWSLYYHTIDARCRRAAQRSFIDLYKKGYIYRAKEPVLWCPYHQTAIAQAEVEDKEESTTLNYLYFSLENGKRLEIATTRPELLCSCVAVFVHPEDTRYQKLVGKNAIIPLFNYKVPIKADPEVDPNFGTGVVMVCTFGDTTDIEWWRRHKLPLKMSVTKDGRLDQLGGRYEGQKLLEARKNIVGDLKRKNLLTRQEKMRHVVGACWRCDTNVEFRIAEQWFIRTLDFKKELIEQGRKLRWYPSYYCKRYENWVENLQWDWCISRQRYYGTPFPVWYCKKCGAVMLGEDDNLPVDPTIDKPGKPCKCGGSDFLPEEDVMDTWMTSSLTPMITSKWREDKDFFARLFPSSMRPQAHDIIRTWAFYTILKAYLHEQKIPWKDVMVSGHGLAEKGIPMSKSKGKWKDVIELAEKWGADTVRLWSATGKLGEDLVYREQDMVRAKKVLIKLWNVSRFAGKWLKGKEIKSAKLRLVDRWILSKLSKVIENCTRAWDSYDLSHARKEVEVFFLHTFCDYYLEMIKYRVYGEVDKESKEAARFTLAKSLLALLRLFAPFVPFITEEIHHEVFDHGSIHLKPWPLGLLKDKEAEEKGDLALKLIGVCRKYKTEHNLSVGAEIKEIVVYAKKELGEVLEDIQHTLRAGKIRQVMGKRTSLKVKTL